MATRTFMPAPDDATENLSEVARRAVIEANKYLPQWRSFARMIGRNNKLDLKLTGTHPQTDGKTVWVQVPLDLGRTPDHVRSLCGQRNEHGLLKCTACRAHENVMLAIIHEIGHVVFGTFEQVEPWQRAQALQDAIRLEANNKPDGSRAKKIQQRIEQAPGYAKNDFLNLSQFVSPYLPILVNAIEDTRVNLAMFRARKGIQNMFDAWITGVFRDGAQGPDGKIWQWKDRDADAQAIIASYCESSHLPWREYLHPDVVARLDDPEFLKLCAKADRISNVAGSYGLAIPVLECLRRLGFCKAPEDEEDDEPEPEEGDGEDDPQDGGEDGASDPSSGSGSSDADADSQSGDDPQDGNDDDDTGDKVNEDQAEEEGNANGSDEADSEDEAGTSPEQGGEGSEGDDGPGESSEGSGESDSDDDVDGDEPGGAEQGGSEPGLDDDGGQPGEGAGGASQDHGGSDPTNSGVSGNNPAGADAGAGDQAGGPPSGNDPSAGPRSAGVSEHAPGTSGGGGGSTQGDYVDEPEPAPSGATPEEVAELFIIFGGHAKPEDEGDPDAHSSTLGEYEPTPEESKEVDRAIVQVEHFDKPSDRLQGLRLHKWPEDQGKLAWSGGGGYGGRTNAYGGSGTVQTVPERLLAPALHRLRILFTENRKGAKDVNLRKGRVNPKKVGPRFVAGRDDLFYRRRNPGKRDYFVVLGADISGSTAGEPIQLIKDSFAAMGDLMSRLGVKFAMYCHSGSGRNVDIFEIKGPDEGWGPKPLERLNAISDFGANLDGHTLEFYRKVLDRRTETDKMCFFYTDGQLNRIGEEYEVFSENVNIMRKKNYTCVGVEVDTDSGMCEVLGMDTVRIDGGNDVIRVVNKLQQLLARKGAMM